MIELVFLKCFNSSCTTNSLKTKKFFGKLDINPLSDGNNSDYNSRNKEICYTVKN